MFWQCLLPFLIFHTFFNPSLSLIPIIHLMTTYCLPVTEDPGSSRSAVGAVIHKNDPGNYQPNHTTPFICHLLGRPWRPCLHWVIIAASSARLLWMISANITFLQHLIYLNHSPSPSSKQLFTYPTQLDSLSALSAYGQVHLKSCK